MPACSLLISWKGGFARTWEEGVDPALQGTEFVAARAQHVLFERWNAGNMHQQPVHHEWRKQGQPVPDRSGRCKQRPATPEEPFEEVVGMARVAPEPDLTDFRLCFGRL